MEQFKKCMLTEYDEGESQHKWTKWSEFGVNDHSWVKDIYKRMKMWMFQCTHISH